MRLTIIALGLTGVCTFATAGNLGRFEGDWVSPLSPTYEASAGEGDPFVKQSRSWDVWREFKRQQPCPATGRSKGSCQGWIIDHIRPLCAGGADATWNMQWQTKEAAAIKDKDEFRECAALRAKRRAAR
jgi:hypothetical protein